MAKTLDEVRVICTSATLEFDEDQVVFEYRISENDLSKYSRWLASGVDTTQSVSGVWTDSIAQIKSMEGII